MSAPALESTMPAQAVPDLTPSVVRRAGQRAAVCVTGPQPRERVVRSAPDLGGSADADARVIAANERAAALEEQLATMTAERDAAEHRAAELQGLNRELASDLDNALDQLAGHALHAEQERLIRPSRWEVRSALAGWAGGSALADRDEGGHER